MKRALLAVVIAVFLVAIPIKVEAICVRYESGITCFEVPDVNVRIYPQSSFPFSGPNWSQGGLIAPEWGPRAGGRVGAGGLNYAPASPPPANMPPASPNYSPFNPTAEAQNYTSSYNVLSGASGSPPSIQVPDYSPTVAEIVARSQAVIDEVRAAGMAAGMFYFQINQSLAKRLATQQQEQISAISKADLDLAERLKVLQASSQEAVPIYGELTAAVNAAKVRELKAADPPTNPTLATNDTALKGQLSALEARLNTTPAIFAAQQEAAAAARIAIAEADKWSVSGDGAEADAFASIAELLVDVATSIPPGIGWARDVLEAVSGHNLINGEQLSLWEHSIAFIGAVSGGVGSEIIKSERYLQRLGEITLRLLRETRLYPNTKIETVIRAYESAKEILRSRISSAPSRYKINGYIFETDNLLRIKEISGELRLEALPQNSYQQRLVRDAMGNAGDDAGHLIAARFGGVAERVNLVAMDAGLNRGAYRDWENSLANQLSENRAVSVRIRPIYSGAELRPSHIEASWTIDGVLSNITWINK